MSSIFFVFVFVFFFQSERRHHHHHHHHSNTIKRARKVYVRKEYGEFCLRNVLLSSDQWCKKIWHKKIFIFFTIICTSVTTTYDLITTTSVRSSRSFFFVCFFFPRGEFVCVVYTFSPLDTEERAIRSSRFFGVRRQLFFSALYIFWDIFISAVKRQLSFSIQKSHHYYTRAQRQTYS